MGFCVYVIQIIFIQLPKYYHLSWTQLNPHSLHGMQNAKSIKTKNKCHKHKAYTCLKCAFSLFSHKSI